MSNIVNAVVDSVSNAASYVSESVQQASASAEKATNKEVAKDSNASIGTRASAGLDAVGNKLDESKHDAKASAHKQSI